MTGHVIPPEREVTVTVTPGGAFRDITVGGHSIAAAIMRSGVSLTLQPGDLPTLRFVLIADKIIVKEDE